MTSSSTQPASNSAAATVSYFLRFVAPPALRSESRLRATNTNLGSYSTHDANLAFTGYGLLFVSEVLKRVAAAAAQSPDSPATPAATASTTNPAIALIAKLLFARSTLTGSPLVSPATVADVATRSRTLSSLISDIRIFNRLWGLVPLAVWAFDTAAAPPSDPVLRAVAYTQVAANLLYQPLENVAYLAMHGVIGGVSDSAQMKLWIYSCYLWAAHVVLDFIRIAREYALAKRAAAASEKAGEKKVKLSQWWQSIVINLSYLPLTVHWSLEKGCLPDIAVGFLGATAALASIYPRWTAIAAIQDDSVKAKEE